jgi:hypothetical protein
VADGRAYFGFGASATGTLSLVLAPNTQQFIIQDNSGYGFLNLAATNQIYQANHWYRLEVAWGTDNSITGRLYDSDGKTLLNAVQSSAVDIKSGGIAFRGTWDPKYFDTVTVTPNTAGNLAKVSKGAPTVFVVGVPSDAGNDAGRLLTLMSGTGDTIGITVHPAVPVVGTNANLVLSLLTPRTSAATLPSVLATARPQERSIELLSTPMPETIVHPVPLGIDSGGQNQAIDSGGQNQGPAGEQYEREDVEDLMGLEK